jgi:hypothetical protein
MKAKCAWMAIRCSVPFSTTFYLLSLKDNLVIMQWNDEEALQVTESMANNIQNNEHTFKFQSIAEYNGHLLQVPKVNLAERTQIKSLIITSVMSTEIYYHSFLFFSYIIGTYIVTSTDINFLEFMETQKEHGLFLQYAVTSKLR